MNSPRRQLLRITAIAAGLSLALVGCSGSPSPASTNDGASADEPSPVTIRAMTAQVRDANEHLGFWSFVDELSENAPWITIEYMGGPETIPGTEQAEAVMSGAVDMSSLCSCYYSHLLQFADVMGLATTSPLEDRENGAFEILDSMHADNGLKLVGQGLEHYGAQMQLGEKYKSLDPNNIDLDGFLIRGSASQMPAIEGLGGQSVNLPISEVYNAMDRGTTDGFIAGNFGVEGLGLKEAVVATLNVELMSGAYPIVMNLAKWDSLEPATQDAINQAIVTTEGKLGDIFLPLVEGQLADFEADGIEIVTPSSSESARITEIVVNGAWDDLLSRSPESMPLAEIYGIK